MKIEDLIKLSENAVRRLQTSSFAVHVNPKSENEIYSSYDNKGNLVERGIRDKGGSGFTIYLEHGNGLFWLFLVKRGIRIYESRIIIDHFRSDKCELKT